MSNMRTIQLKVADLFEFEGPPVSQAPNCAVITALVAKQFAFLPQPVMMRLEGDDVILTFPEESSAAQAEARLTPPPLVNHLESRELTHLKLESEARKAGENLFFATTAKTRDTVIQSVSGDIRKWDKEGHFAG